MQNAPENAQPENMEGTSAAQPEVIVETPESDATRALEKQRDEYLALAQRVQADFDNFRRRNASMRQDARDEGIRETLTALLPVLDNLDLAIKHGEQSEASAAMLDGVRMVSQQCRESLNKRFGLEEIPAQGGTFDPTMHNAVAQTPAEEGQSDDEIVEVFQKGYRVGEKVLRYSMVRVAKQ